MDALKRIDGRGRFYPPLWSGLGVQGMRREIATSPDESSVKKNASLVKKAVDAFLIEDWPETNGLTSRVPTFKLSD